MANFKDNLDVVVEKENLFFSDKYNELKNVSANLSCSSTMNYYQQVRLDMPTLELLQSSTLPESLLGRVDPKQFEATLADVTRARLEPTFSVRMIVFLAILILAILIVAAGVPAVAISASLHYGVQLMMAIMSGMLYVATALLCLFFYAIYKAGIEKKKRMYALLAFANEEYYHSRHINLRWEPPHTLAIDIALDPNTTTTSTSTPPSSSLQVRVVQGGEENPALLFVLRDRIDFEDQQQLRRTLYTILNAHQLLIWGLLLASLMFPALFIVPALIENRVWSIGLVVWILINLPFLAGVVGSSLKRYRALRKANLQYQAMGISFTTPHQNYVDINITQPTNLI